MVIEILTFDGCPNAQTARERVEGALQIESTCASVHEVKVNTIELAQSSRFLGSPSIRIDGCDIEPGADHRRDYGLMCRTYRAPEATEGAPPISMIRKAIQARLR